MKNYFILFLVLFILSACNEDPSNDLIVECQPSTGYFGSFLMKFYSQNLATAGRTPSRQESACWEDIYPFQVGFTGTGNCGEGYEMVKSPYLGPGIVVSEFDENAEEPFMYGRYLEVRAIFPCQDFSSPNGFFALFEERQYGFATNHEDMGNFIVEFYDHGKRYSSLEAPNQTNSIYLSELQFISEDGVEFVDATVHFGALLKYEAEEYLQVENAKVKGRFYRMSPWGFEWEE